MATVWGHDLRADCTVMSSVTRALRTFERPEEQSRAQRAGQKQHSAIAYRDRAPHRAPQAGKDQHFRMVSTATGWVLLPSVNVRMHACLHACMHACLSVCLSVSVSQSVCNGRVGIPSFSAALVRASARLLELRALVPRALVPCALRDDSCH